MAVVAVDDVTFADLPHDTWPFRRRLHAQLIDRLRRAGARVIAYDVEFTGQTDAADDGALLDATARAGNVVLASSAVDEAGQSPVFGGPGTVREVGASTGNVFLPDDDDGSVRRFTLRANGQPAFAAQAYARFTGHQPRAGGFRDGDAIIDFRGPPGTVKTYSFSRVLAGKVAPDAFKGKIVVVGATDPTLHDLVKTPTATDVPMAGAEAQANAIDTLLRGVPLRRAPGALDVALIVLMGVLGPLIATGLRAWLAPFAVVAAGLAYALAAQLVFDSGTVVTVAYPLVLLAASSIAALAVRSVATAYERQRTRDAFARFVPESVVDDVLQRAGGGLRLGGVKRVGTVMFTDLRGFTAFAERLDVEDVIEALNEYLGGMSDAILDQGGTLVSYMGDGIMAVFGAPLDQPDHADRALACARDMLEVRLPRFNDWLAEKGLGGGFRMGIGLNSGDVLSGNVGSQRRMEYTALGDTTNTAARLEAMTKDGEHQLLLSDATRAALSEQAAAGLVTAGESVVRGRQAPVALWTLA